MTMHLTIRETFSVQSWAYCHSWKSFILRFLISGWILYLYFWNTLYEYIYRPHFFVYRKSVNFFIISCFFFIYVDRHIHVGCLQFNFADFRFQILAIDRISANYIYLWFVSKTILANFHLSSAIYCRSVLDKWKFASLRVLASMQSVPKKGYTFLD